MKLISVKIPIFRHLLLSSYNTTVYQTGPKGLLNNIMQKTVKVNWTLNIFTEIDFISDHNILFWTLYTFMPMSCNEAQVWTFYNLTSISEAEFTNFDKCKTSRGSFYVL